ncbi:(2Fe-2S)-binding protein [Microvirga pudoricolor]|uniref:(2Fe-2S)-binding protein n=1 Tax=Microvirga pudoricolor TaxID=2778729 RepID=UPI00194E177B|nr:(2Fe-2S)-binding protein [Microvirga pudoricolor]
MSKSTPSFTRIEDLPTRRVSIEVDGRSATAFEGEPLVIALASLGMTRLRSSPRASAPRGGFCFMGVCQECVVHVDGRLLRSCLTPVEAGMVVSLGKNS